MRVCVPVGSKRRLCHHHHGPVLVYRMYAPGHNCLAANCPVPHDGHHDGRQGTMQSFSSVRCHLGIARAALPDAGILGVAFWSFSLSGGPLCFFPGEHRVPEGLKHAVHWWAPGGHRGGELEPAQAHCPEGPAAGWCSSLPVRELTIAL